MGMKINLTNLQNTLSKGTLLSPNQFDGVLFKDVKDLIKSKEDLENLLFSTKILFESKEEVIEFFSILLKYGKKESALNYLEELITQINDADMINKFNSLLQ